MLKIGAYSAESGKMTRMK